MLLCFQAVSGLKINLDKSELSRTGNNGDSSLFAKVLGCKAVNFPLKYLGIPLRAKYKEKTTWDLVIELCENKLAGWKRNFLSKSGRLTLIKSTMVNLPIYYPATHTIPINIEKKLETIQCRFLWDDEENNRKYHLVKWEEIKKPVKK